jgi:hypothetical protein
MSTATPEILKTHREESRRQVTHPLQRLRGYIRLYVGLEGLAVALLYLGLWFWIGLLVDYGFFRAFTIDWVQELPRWVRVVLLVGLGTGLLLVLAVRLFGRLFREFRDASLALLLERRFTELLGDRLITAVELADSHKPRRYGYSPVMVEQTIHDAAERVNRLPINDVLDWHRLRRLGRAIALIIAGPYVLAGATYAAFHRGDVNGFVQRFNDIALIWFERNIALIDTIWPRHAYLELLNEEFLHGDEMRIGRDTQPPALRVRALKWVIADSDPKRAPEGWRALMWSDLTPKLLGKTVSADAVPAAWRKWTVDRIEQELDKPEVSGNMPDDTLFALRDILQQLQETAASRSRSRQLRELEIPQEVTVYYKGATSRSDQTMQQLVGNEYAGVPDLKESIQFTVRGRDYYTPPKRITVVPPPSIVELTLDEAQPAYLYHQPPSDGSKEDLRGKKQRFKDRPVSLTGDTSRVDVPVGTDVVLTAKTDKDLRKPKGVGLLPGRKGLPELDTPVEQSDDHTFHARFDHVTAPVDVIFRFIDTDGVAGQRHVVIRPVEDSPPEVDAQIEVVRKTSQGYMVTPMAQVPFSGKVRDDRGLAKVEYAYTVAGADAAADAGARAAAAAGLAASLSGSWTTGLTGVALVSGPNSGPGAEEEGKAPKTVASATFEQLLRERSLSRLPLAKLEASLEQPPGEDLLKDYNLDPDVEAFGVDQLGLKVADEKANQPRYRLRLWLVATDNNVESGPRTGQSKERFTVLVVSEHELLAEIAKEEESLHIKLEDAVSRLKDSKVKLAKVIQEMPELKRDEFSPMARRTEEIGEAVVKSWDATREVFGDYKRILKELRANHVQPGMINKVNDKICEPLDRAINLEFVQSDESLHELQKKLDSKTNDPKAAELARQQLDQLIERLSGVLEAMADVTTINRIIEMLVKIEKGEREEYERLQKLLKQKQEEVLENLSEPKKPEK